MGEFKQKRRDRAIDITDIAISKVPIIKIEGFNSEQLEFIREKHCDVLRIAKVLNYEHKTNEMECGILIDLHSWECVIIRGKANLVVLDETPNAKIC